MRFEILQTCVIPVLCGRQTWTFTKGQIQAIQVSERKIERRILGISVKDKMKNEELRKKEWNGGRSHESQETQMWLRWTRSQDEPGQVGLRHNDVEPETRKKEQRTPRQIWSQEFSAVD